MKFHIPNGTEANRYNGSWDYCTTTKAVTYDELDLSRDVMIGIIDAERNYTPDQVKRLDSKKGVCFHLPKAAHPFTHIWVRRKDIQVI